MKKYFELTKFGIVFFVLFTATGGYFIGHPFQQDVSFFRLLLTLTGLYFLSSGSFALNQYQEREIDKKMPRTQKRPLPSGRVTPKQALIFAISFVVMGTLLLALVSWKVLALGWFTLVLYNYFYTHIWKRSSPFAAVPGAIPGAMPFAIGYTAASDVVFDVINIYFFLLMFFWQMPHFWALALRYKDDYQKGGIPVLPAARGQRATEYYVGIYTFTYLALALSAPLILPVGWVYLIIAVPFAFKVLWELFRFVKDPMGKPWLGFFLWTTFSVLVFIIVPAIDRWLPWI
jgi:heme o synthase